MNSTVINRYAKQIEKARIPVNIAEELAEKLYKPEAVFSVIDRTFMKAKFSGLTASEIIAIMRSGAFSNDLMDEKKLIALKPYLKFWPTNPVMAKMAFDAGMTPGDITKIGVANISEESLKLMISLN